MKLILSCVSFYLDLFYIISPVNGNDCVKQVDWHFDLIISLKAGFGVQDRREGLKVLY
jgi:hypothetical protein